MVEENDFGPLEDCLAVSERAALCCDGSAVHAEPKAIGTSRRFGCAVIQIPYFNAPRVVPVDPLPVPGIFPIAFFWQSGSGIIPELTRAVLAVAYAVTV